LATFAGSELRTLRCPAANGATGAGGADVTALDASRNRLKRLKVNLDRLGLQATLVEGDAATWRPKELFDAVLLDAPCSSTGTVRRHPDIPWTKSSADVEKLAGVQRRLLDAAVKLVKPGGQIVFSNCSSTRRKASSFIQPSWPKMTKLFRIRSNRRSLSRLPRLWIAGDACAPRRPT
jgi:16S rRNA (cytosine967-C5)-methyltransferase